MQKAIRANTFEVVMKKPVADSATYEKPLPLELLPFHERFPGEVDGKPVESTVTMPVVFKLSPSPIA
jgi:hypothetical protein